MVQHTKQRLDCLHVVGNRVDADDRVAAAEHESIDDAGRDSFGVVGGMIRLQARGEAARQADRGAEARHHADLRGDGNQVLQAHDFRNGRGHLRRNPRRERGQHGACGLFAEQPIAEIANGQRRHRSESARVVIRDDQPCDFVVFRRYDKFRKECFKRKIRQRHLRGDSFLRR